MTFSIYTIFCFRLYNKQNITRWLEDITFILSCWKQYFTHSLCSFVKYCFHHSKIKSHIFAPPCNILYISKNLFQKMLTFQFQGWKNTKNFLGENTPRPPSTYDTTPNFLSPTTICHLSTLSIVWSLFVDAHPPDKFLKKALCSNHFAV